MTSAPLVLVVEDQRRLRRYLRTSLMAERFRVIEAETAEQALAATKVSSPAIVLLDLGLPDHDGIQFTERLRQWSRTPVIVISARCREEDKLKAFEAGADDYLTKPFGVQELLARIRVALRHAAQTASKSVPVYEFGPLKIDVESRLVTVGGREVHLTPTEYKCLVLLAQHAGKVLTHGQILREIWGPAHLTDTHYVRVRMAELRRKLERTPGHSRILLTEPGVGYRLRA